MRKRIIPTNLTDGPNAGSEWLPLQELAIVEITSEAADYPIEAALLDGDDEGWRAAVPGAQLLRVRFDIPQRLEHIHLCFVEQELARTQEFTLRASHDYNRSFQEIVRQQWTFSPRGSTREVEDYAVDLQEVTTLELRIMPDISGGGAHASLAEMRLR